MLSVEGQPSSKLEPSRSDVAQTIAQDKIGQRASNDQQGVKFVLQYGRPFGYVLILASAIGSWEYSEMTRWIPRGLQ